MPSQPHAEITRAAQAFMDTLVDAQALAAAGEYGSRLAGLLERARNLLDIVDERMLGLDQAKYADAFVLAAKMRADLRRLTAAAAPDPEEARPASTTD